MGDDSVAQGGQFTTRVERVVAADPTSVWALIADPGRIGEWAGVTTVGYMGTELPRVGQAVFVRTSRWLPPSRARRVVVEAWEAGTGYRCRLDSPRGGHKVRFEAQIIPEITGGSIATRTCLVQRTEMSRFLIPVVRRLVRRRLRRTLDRIERVVEA